MHVREVLPEQVRHILRRLEAFGGILRVQLLDDAAEPLRHFGDDLTHRPGSVVGHALQNRQCRLRSERRPASQHRVNHAAEAEKVGAVIERFPTRLFRRHVHRRTGHNSATCQAGIVGGTRQPKVRDLHLLLRSVIDQDVRRLDVAVNQSLVVGGSQTLRDLPGDIQSLRRVKRAGAVEAVLQCFTRHEFHDEKRQRFFSGLVNADDVLVLNQRRGPRFAQERLRAGDVAAIAGDSTFTATTRWSTSSKARKTMPKPPRPSTSNTS